MFLWPMVKPVRFKKDEKTTKKRQNTGKMDIYKIPKVTKTTF
jgi:hypothetical protein